MDPKLKYCPEDIRAHPLPYDDCSAPHPPWSSPALSYRKLSIFADVSLNLQFDQIDRLLAFGSVFRPTGKTATGFWGFGAQLETNVKNHWTALGRLQTSFNNHHYGKDRFTLAALGGLHHEDGGRNSAQIGMEAAWEWRAVQSMTLTLPLLSARYTFTGSTAEKAVQAPAWNMILGARLSFDLLPVGE